MNTFRGAQGLNEITTIKNWHGHMFLIDVFVHCFRYAHSGRLGSGRGPKWKTKMQTEIVRNPGPQIEFGTKTNEGRRIVSAARIYGQILSKSM